MSRVLALVKYGAQAASTRQRLLQYLPYMAERGIDFEVRPLLSDSYVAHLAQDRHTSLFEVGQSYARRLLDIRYARNFDLIWIYLELLPFMPAFMERLIYHSGKPVILDYDDAIFHQYDGHRSRLVRSALGKKLVPLMQGACACFCGNGYIANYASRFTPHTVVVPTVVDTLTYAPAAIQRDGPLTLGWIGSPSTWRYVEPLLPIILTLLARHGARFRVIGAGPRARGIDGIDAIDWAEQREIADIQAMDIGIMPLPDEPWARGKCGYKLIQYMACGLPTVASPVGVNADIVINGETGFLAASDVEWIGAIERLLLNAEMRRLMGIRGRQRIEEHYSLQSQQPRILRELQRCLHRS